MKKSSKKKLTRPRGASNTTMTRTPIAAIGYEGGYEGGFYEIEDLEKVLGVSLPNAWENTGEMLYQVGWSEYPFADETHRRPGSMCSLSIFPGKNRPETVIELDYGAIGDFVVVRGRAALLEARIALVPLLL